ncbi:hypothetical protein SESBI_04287 [Sesbania bispinosa]|nr:hypothetical protein SESBI_04287 [Sesbania bispinosa]
MMGIYKRESGDGNFVGGSIGDGFRAGIRLRCGVARGWWSSVCFTVSRCSSVHEDMVSGGEGLVWIRGKVVLVLGLMQCSLMVLVSRWCDGGAAMVVVGRLKMASERMVGSVLKPHHRRDKKG